MTERQSMKAKKKYQEGVKILLREIRADTITPDTILSDGSEAGQFAVDYLRRYILYEKGRQRKSSNKRGRPKKVLDDPMQTAKPNKQTGATL